MVLSELKKGDFFKIIRVKLDREIGKRLADMGLNKGTSGQVVRSALLGDPIEITVLGYNLSLRKSEAAGIEIEKTDKPAEDGQKNL